MLFGLWHVEKVSLCMYCNGSLILVANVASELTILLDREHLASICCPGCSRSGASDTRQRFERLDAEFFSTWQLFHLKKFQSLLQEIYHRENDLGSQTLPEKHASYRAMSESALPARAVKTRSSVERSQIPFCVICNGIWTGSGSGEMTSASSVRTLGCGRQPAKC